MSSPEGDCGHGSRDLDGDKVFRRKHWELHKQDMELVLCYITMRVDFTC